MTGLGSDGESAKHRATTMSGRRTADVRGREGDASVGERVPQAASSPWLLGLRRRETAPLEAAGPIPPAALQSGEERNDVGGPAAAARRQAQRVGMRWTVARANAICTSRRLMGQKTQEW